MQGRDSHAWYSHLGSVHDGSAELRDRRSWFGRLPTEESRLTAVPTIPSRLPILPPVNGEVAVGNTVRGSGSGRRRKPSPGSCDGVGRYVRRAPNQ